MKCVKETTFPAKYSKNGTLRYISVPILVVERMGLREGEHINVTISRPELIEYDVEEEVLSAEKKRSSKEE